VSAGDGFDPVGSAVVEVPVNATTPNEEANLTTAEDVVNALRDAGLPIGEVKVYDAITDPNKQIGRPNGNTAKANFHDTRLELTHTSDNQLDSSSGGSAEVFADHAGAQAHAEYLATVTKGIPALTEYDCCESRTPPPQNRRPPTRRPSGLTTSADRPSRQVPHGHGERKARTAFDDQRCARGLGDGEQRELPGVAQVNGV
jgi:hypothetical protein